MKLDSLSLDQKAVIRSLKEKYPEGGHKACKEMQSLQPLSILYGNLYRMLCNEVASSEQFFDQSDLVMSMSSVAELIDFISKYHK